MASGGRHRCRTSPLRLHDRHLPSLHMTYDHCRTGENNGIIPLGSSSSAVAALSHEDNVNALRAIFWG